MAAGDAVRDDDGRPLRDQVADKIRDLINGGTLQWGDRLDSENILAERYGVSRETLRAALDTLTHEGLLTSGRGRGRTVRAYRPLVWDLSYESRSQHEKSGDPGDQWDAAVRAAGRKPGQEVAVSIIEPPAEIAGQLEIPAGELVVLRARVRLVDGVAYQLANSYFPESLVRGTPLMEPRDVHAPGGVLASIGRPQSRFRDQVRARMPTAAEAARLVMVGRRPVLEITRVGYDEHGVPLRVMVTVAPGDRHVLVYDQDAS